MKKLLLCTAVCLTALTMLPSCKREVDYFSYVSEYRKSVYYYEDDEISLKVYGLDRETPSASDGVKGSLSSITEVYFSSENTASEVSVQLLGREGEMSYQSVTRSFYLSFTGEEMTAASLPVVLKIDGNEKKIDVANVATEGVIDGATALKCVREYDADTFANLTANGVFAGEICLRLLYDEGCYYYVGVCDREKNVHAYLVDGDDGKIIAERESVAEG